MGALKLDPIDAFLRDHNKDKVRKECNTPHITSTTHPHAHTNSTSIHRERKNM